MFNNEQIKSLYKRLMQTTEELLYDGNESRNRYNYKQKGKNVLGVAHCDYVSEAWSRPKRTGNIITSGQVDDRVGVWLLLDVLPGMGMEFDTLLTTDEEIGRSTAEEAAYSECLNYGWTFQFDRRGDDFVDYGLASNDFREEFRIKTGIPHGKGTFSDICSLPDECGSCVNIGTGYHGEHFPTAYVDLDECWKQVVAFERFFSENKESSFPVYTKSKKKDRAGILDVEFNSSFLDEDGDWWFNEITGRYEFVGSEDRPFCIDESQIKEMF